jgi:hypothetical protein
MSPASELAWRNGSYVRLTLLFENNNFTPLPELVWVMVLSLLTVTEIIE